MFSWLSITIEQHADHRPLSLGCSPGKRETGDRKTWCSGRRGNLDVIRPPYHCSRQLTPVHATSKITPLIGFHHFPHFFSIQPEMLFYSSKAKQRLAVILVVPHDKLRSEPTASIQMSNVIVLITEIPRKTAWGTLEYSCRFCLIWTIVWEKKEGEHN